MTLLAGMMPAGVLSMVQINALNTLSLAFGLPGHGEWIILLVLGLLIFGRRLPEVGRSLGKGIVEFKRGIRGIDDEIEQEAARPSDQIEDKSAKTEIPQTSVGEEAGNPYQPAEPARDS
jgi:sec-independent protein translocase protein TatA